jgi:hypothetical protein
LLSSFRQKQLSSQDIAALLSKMREQRLTQIPLWRASTFTRLSTSTARLQGYLVIIAGLLFIPAAIYDKYQEDPSKLTRLALYTPVATLFVLAPMYLYRRSARTLLTAIDYNVSERAFELRTFSNQLLKVEAENVQVMYNPQKPKVVHQIALLNQKKQNVFKIEGYGEWESPELFRFITQSGGISEQLV